MQQLTTLRTIRQQLSLRVELVWVMAVLAAVTNEPPRARVGSVTAPPLDMCR
jgi:hypothetical protein